MKRTYINPETKIVKIKTSCHMLEASTMYTKGDYNSENVTIGSRRGRNTFWEDDEE